MKIKNILLSAIIIITCLLPIHARDITREEALKFLYEYLPLPDRVCYSEEFYSEAVDATLRAREDMPWGRDVPEREFFHFVLPLRVNNEMLDASRPIFYGELKERVKNLSMEEAILEVNHWCHEKVTYQPSDARTSNPLSAVSQAIGRCGEESTFTVAALRAVGIPARQVYTPRWAHTDDNHAWVEAWANGKWHFLGACEPEPVLDLGWFNLPASRALMMTTNVFGKYDGPEEKLKETGITTTINVTSNYAPAGTLKVLAVDAEGNPIEGADVSFCIYNYAEFSPVAEKRTDINGEAEIICGLGDMVVWGVSGDKFGFVKGNPREGLCRLVIDKDADFTGDFELDIIPPAESRNIPFVSDEAREANSLCFAREDSLRNAYVSTFVTPGIAEELALANGWDGKLAADILVKSRGNHDTILRFIESLDESDREKGWRLLSSLCEKDLRDISAEVLADNLTFTRNMVPAEDAEIYGLYLLNPRVEYEWLVPYKASFSRQIYPSLRQMAQENPELWAKWIRENIRVETASNPQRLHIAPTAVWEQRCGDPRSIGIFIVSSLRSMGVPSRFSPMTGEPQYLLSGEWIDARLTDAPSDVPAVKEKAKLTLDLAEGSNVRKPLYYSHFALHRIADGKPSQLEFEEGSGIEEVNEDLSLDPGQYMALTGQRLADGSVLVKGKVFRLNPGEQVAELIELRKDDGKVSVIGSLNAENLYYDISAGREKSILSTTGRGNFIVGILKANSEPSAHALNDISLRRTDFESLGTPVMLLLRDESEMQRFDAGKFPNLPSTVTLGVDSGSVSLSELMESLSLTEENLPVFVIADSFNRVLFLSQGYTIGLGDKLLEILDALSK